MKKRITRETKEGKGRSREDLQRTQGFLLGRAQCSMNTIYSVQLQCIIRLGDFRRIFNLDYIAGVDIEKRVANSRRNTGGETCASGVK
jgi:hypothetical protein